MKTDFRTVFVLIGLAFASHAHAAALSFDEALSLIVDRNTVARSSEAELNGVMARNLPTRASFLPSLSLDANQTTNKSQGHTAVTSKTAEATARLNLFRFGADLAANQAASRDEDAARASFESAVLAAESSAVQTLLAEIQNRKEVDVQTRIVRSQEELLKIGRESYARGLLPRQEADKLSIDLDNALAGLRDAQIRQSQGSANLLSALGSSEIAIEWPWRERFNSSAIQKLERTELELKNVPEWRAAEARFEAENERKNRNFRQIFPSIDGSFAYGYTNSLGSGSTSWTGILGVTVPLFDQLSNYSNYRAQVYTAQISENKLEQTARDARAEWSAATQSFEISLSSAQARDRTANLARTLYEDSMRRFRAGRMNANELVVEQKRVFDSELYAIRGWNATHLAFTRLCHARGLRVAVCFGSGK